MKRLKIFVLLTLWAASFGSLADASEPVTFYGWGGDPQVNRWFDDVAAPALKERHGFQMKRVGMNIDEILNKLHVEKLANSEKGTIDVIWINGENFAAARKLDLLHGPFTQLLPNFLKYVDVAAPSVTHDFGYPTEGYEAPFGSAQLVFFADTAKMKDLPLVLESLMETAKANPGRLAYAAPPDFTGSAFVRTVLNLNAAAQDPMEYLRRLAPYLYQQGRTYVSTTARLINMYADGEVLMGMSYTPFLAFRKMESGEFPASTRPFVFDGGTVANTHFLAIPFNAPNKAGALALIDLLLSPELQASKMDPKGWGDLPVLEWERLSDGEKTIFERLLSEEEQAFLLDITQKRIPEFSADRIPEINKMWLEEVPER